MMQFNACSHTCVFTTETPSLNKKGTDLGVLMVLTAEMRGCEKAPPQSKALASWLLVPLLMAERERFFVAQLAFPSDTIAHSPKGLPV